MNNEQLKTKISSTADNLINEKGEKSIEKISDFITNKTKGKTQNKIDVSIMMADEGMAETFGKIHFLAWKQAYNNAFPSDYIETVTIDDRKESFLRKVNDLNNYFFIVKYEEVQIGVLHLSKKQDLITGKIEGEIVSIYLLEEYCSKGCGSIILDFAVKYLKDNQCTKIFLWVLEFNDRARRAYEKYGFAFEGNQREISRGNMYRQLKYVLL